MKESQFRENLDAATKLLMEFSQEFLIDELPLHYAYLIFPNQSYDGNPLAGDEELFPEDSLFSNNENGYSRDEVIKFLWRKNKVPEWINIMVHSYNEKLSYISLICCGRFTADDQLLYHEREGYQPFHILGPNLPPNFENIEKIEKFNLAWHGRTPNINEPHW